MLSGKKSYANPKQETEENKKMQSVLQDHRNERKNNNNSSSKYNNGKDIDNIWSMNRTDIVVPITETYKRCPGFTDMNNNKQMELNFDEDELMTYFRTNLGGNDSVAVGNTPGDAETYVDENMQRFGDIKQRYKSKKNIWGKVVNTGIWVYSIILKKPISKHYIPNIQIYRTGQTYTTRHGREEQNPSNLAPNCCLLQSKRRAKI